MLLVGSEILVDVEGWPVSCNSCDLPTCFCGEDLMAKLSCT